MKKTLQKHAVLSIVFLVVIASLSMVAPAAPAVNLDVTAAQAWQVAGVKLLSTNAPCLLDSCTPVVKDGRTLFYVFTLQPCGYLVVSGCRALPAVMAYSWNAPFGALSAGNPLYEMLCTDYTLRLDAVGTLPASTLAQKAIAWQQSLHPSQGILQQWPPEGSTPTGGWVLTLWTQNGPYNNFCPYLNGARSLAGCPAVAMAQICAYFNTTKNVSFSDSDDYYHNYGGNAFYIDNDYGTYQFPSWPQLNGYLTTLNQHWMSHTPLTDQDKAALNAACGFAMHQVYSTSGSGTFGVDQAFMAYQRFGFTDAVLYEGESPEMFARLSANMKAAIPAHIAVVDQGWTVGHNMVVDGYNTDDYYHINFGWGGSYNGWYHIPDDLPYSLTVVEGVVVDIMPSENFPPSTPGPVTGPTEGFTHISYTYSVDPVTDPEADPVSYLFDWGDGSTSGWIDDPTASHAWTAAGSYQVKVKAKDALQETPWSEPLTVTMTAQQPALTFSKVAGGMGVTATLQNTGEGAASSVAWTLNVTGGLLGRIAVHKTGTIATLPAGGITTLSSGPLLGFGKVAVVVEATSAEGPTAATTAGGTVLFFFTLVG